MLMLVSYCARTWCRAQACCSKAFQFAAVTTLSEEGVACPPCNRGMHVVKSCTMAADFEYGCVPPCSIKSGQPEQVRESSLKYQTRCIRCYPNGTGYALSSIEGRVAMEYFDNNEQVQSRKYAFKCHRRSEAGRDLVYPVNAIAFHPGFGTFATGGTHSLAQAYSGSCNMG